MSEAQRIRLAHLFDPVLAVHTSVVDPLPHQITAIYETMLPRQPLRFLLADDPGAGKTIMAGLLIKELIARGDLQRCLIVCPGSLAEQWQDELYRRFHLPFEILTNDKLEAARTGNGFLETHLVIARLDKLSRNEDVQQKLQAPDGRALASAVAAPIPSGASWPACWEKSSLSPPSPIVSLNRLLPMAPARSRRPPLHRTRSWLSSPSTATRSTISNSASPRCSAARKRWSSSTAASAVKSA